ncbi:tetratricopeptide repeat protein [Salinicola salarius]|uniref:O-linked N-acetylglucosamine transferase family protein n=1 Tax=Salinicola salarius TaxID=430457 RepID=UPI001ABF29EC|nr:tetratricopeptide repeat protein [Salinicola salarius]
MDLYRQGKYKLAGEEAERLVEKYPEDVFAWKALGNCQLQTGHLARAKDTLEIAYEIAPEDPLLLTALSRACFMIGEKDRAHRLQAQSIELDPRNARAHFNMAEMLYQMGAYSKAENYLSDAEELGHPIEEILPIRSIILSLNFRFQEGLDALNQLKALKPQNPSVLNTLGNYHKDMADFKNAEWYYREAQRLSPGYSQAYSNEVLTLHYDPQASAESILQKSREWTELFTPPHVFEHTRTDLFENRTIKVGLVSGNLRAHPVGWMISSALEHLPKDIELHAYTDSESDDPIAESIRKVCHWKPVYHLDHQQLAAKIAEDGIDILIDLAGHGGHSRLPTMDMKPAPIIVKWVGMQISSMGTPAFDYFLSDSIETPVGVDDQYTEKLIRLPDDYVCYQPPSYKPSITSLPALKNGHVTFGCFNNPAKVNDTLLKEWAELLKLLPQSRLFLKGGQYSSPDVCERILNTLESQGIARDRVLLEGPSRHQQLLESYNRVDIALDTWPYSGGLTTCEALLMGVPVVTLPGPTFAGRHSATHLTNAGMQELVVSSWDEYRQRAIELAADLPSLAVIRASLRTYLEQSPICDAPRFGRFLHKALRGIWTRHCQGSAPTALTFNQSGQAWFEGEKQSFRLPKPLRHPAELDEDLGSPITILDNGGILVSRSDVDLLPDSGQIVALLFDPASRLLGHSRLLENQAIQYFPQVTLGDGSPTVLYQDDDEAGGITAPNVSPIGDIENLTIPSIALDSIEGLESFDILALDASFDVDAILTNGSRTLSETLVVLVKLDLTDPRQKDPIRLTEIMRSCGLTLHRTLNLMSSRPTSSDRDRFSENLTSMELIFIPSASRRNTFEEGARTKLSWSLRQLIHTQVPSDLLEASPEDDRQSFTNALEVLNRKAPQIKPSAPVTHWQQVIKSMIAVNQPKESRQHGLKGELIVSLTSYPRRYDYLPVALESLLSQTVKPDRIILWIAEQDRSALSKDILAFEKQSLDIRFCRDIRSYKKIIPALEQFPNAYIVTADDDTYYSTYWLEELVSAHKSSGKIPGHRLHRIVLSASGEPLPYNRWQREIRKDLRPHPLNFPTGIGGVLYPPNSFHSDVTNDELFMSLCPTADDMWLYFMARLAGKEFHPATDSVRILELPGSLEMSLFSENYNGGNDKQMKALLDHYGQQLFNSKLNAKKSGKIS